MTTVGSVVIEAEGAILTHGNTMSDSTSWTGIKNSLKGAWAATDGDDTQADAVSNTVHGHGTLDALQKAQEKAKLVAENTMGSIAIGANACTVEADTKVENQVVPTWGAGS